MANKTYTTRSGDTWDGIAYRALGSELYMDLMLDANSDRTVELNGEQVPVNYIAKFNAGVVLNVPELPAPARPASLPPWRRP